MKGYKTIAWNVANAVVPAMQAVDAAYQIPESWMPYWLGVFILGNIALRIKTTTPVGRKE